MVVHVAPEAGGSGVVKAVGAADDGAGLDAAGEASTVGAGVADGAVGGPVAGARLAVPTTDGTGRTVVLVHAASSSVVTSAAASGPG